jgi:hypothetical protein
MQYDHLAKTEASLRIYDAQRNFSKKTTKSYVHKWSFMEIVSDMGLDG